MNNHHSYTTTGRFWLVFILTICVLCSLYGCGGSFDDYQDSQCELEIQQPEQAKIPAKPSVSSAR